MGAAVPDLPHRFRPQIERYDWLAEAYVQGSWEEEAGPFLANPPTLGLRRGAAATGSKEAIDTFVPGMIMTLDRTFRAGEAPDVVFRRLYARIEPHTTRTEVRSCKSCHNDPEALGYGRGQLRLERTSPGVARWTFVPAAPALPQDGLPADAWIPFLGTRTGRVSTRHDVRPFNVDEQRRILTVGACLTCHDERSPPMQRATQDFPATLRPPQPALRVARVVLTRRGAVAGADWRGIAGATAVRATIDAAARNDGWDR